MSYVQGWGAQRNARIAPRNLNILLNPGVAKRIFEGLAPG